MNESLARLDILLHPAVEGEASEPPPDPLDGQCFLVGTGASGDWSGRDGEMAGWIGNAWVFARPREGMVVRDVSTNAVILYGNGVWTRHQAPTLPTGGSLVDSEARTTIAQLVDVLRDHGFFV